MVGVPVFARGVTEGAPNEALLEWDAFASAAPLAPPGPIDAAEPDVTITGSAPTWFRQLITWGPLEGHANTRFEWRIGTGQWVVELVGPGTTSYTGVQFPTPPAEISYRVAGVSACGQIGTYSGTLVTPTLSVGPAGPDGLTVSWTPETPGFFLQLSQELIEWTDAEGATNPPVTLPIAEGEALFFRLANP